MTSQVSPNKQEIVDLFLLSVLSLYFELIVIRWLGSEIRAFSIFKNFPLIACYIGLGYGLMTSSGKQFLFKAFPAFLLVLTAIIASSQWTGLTDILMLGLRVSGLAGGWWDATHPPTQAISNPAAYVIFSIAAFFTVIILTATTMAGLGQRLGSLFRAEAPLQSYLVNLVGSAVGIAIFSALSFFCTGPIVWLAVGCAMAAWVYRRSKVSIAILVAAVAAVAIIPAKSVFPVEPGAPATILWSPYHRVDLVPFFLYPKTKQRTQVGYEISVNKGFFQQPLNLSDSFINTLPEDKRQELHDFRLDQYELPYLIFHPKRVLIMGSGTGNDVASALRHGAEHVDAVEIDPLMIDLGRKLHPEHPYDSPKVTVVINDARAFLRQNPDKYDLVMTGFLDSHTVAGNSLSVRLDDYVYTVEGMKDALAHVSPNGLYCITYCSVADFLPKRLFTNLQLALGGQSKPLILAKKGGAIYHLFAPNNDQISKVMPELEKREFVNAANVAGTENVRPSTDDWPFLYLSPAAFDPQYLAVNACILLLTWFACGSSVRRESSPRRWHLFCLGAAFLLLELAIIDRLSLIFGTTWIVNSVCIFAILAAIIGANILIIKKPTLMPITVMYGGLLATLLLVYFVPVQLFNTMGIWLGGSLAALLCAIPVFFAGLIFSTAFKSETKPSAGLAFNMMGAVVGGLLEYVGTYTGIRSLLIVAACFYIASLIIWQKSAGQKQSE
jgi:hypothetical protein